MIFRIKRKEFTPDAVGTYFTTSREGTVYKVVYTEDKYIRFAYDDKICKKIVISGVKFSINEFYTHIQKGSLIQVNWNDARVPDSLLEYEVKLEKNV